MFVSLLSKLLASLLVASVCGVILTTVFNQTVMNAHYLEGQFAKVNGYNRLTDAICTDVTQQNSSFAAVAQAAPQLCTSLLSGNLKQQVNGGLDQLQRYYQGKDAAPTIDLSSLASQAQAAGIQLPPNSPLLSPIKITPASSSNKTTTYPGKSYTNTRMFTIVLSILLTVALLAISIIYHRYRILPNVLISVGVFIGITALLFYLGSDVLNHYVHSLSKSSAFIAVGSDLVRNISSDLARRFGLIAATCLVVGIAARIVAGRLQPKALPATTRTAASTKLS